MMRLPITWLVLLAVVAALCMLNGHCWRPGVGGAVGGRPVGTQLERSFGWPATYRSELWRSDDEDLSPRILASAPFYFPGDEMALECRIFGMAALAVDVACALLVILGVVVILEGIVYQTWSARQSRLLAYAGVLLLVLWAASPSCSVSL